MPQPNSTRNDEYTLKIVFSGIVPLVPQMNGSGTPKQLWALVSNLKEPHRLPIPTNGHHQHHHHDHPVHRNRLLIAGGSLQSAGGRSVETGRSVCGELGSFDAIELADEHLYLRADSEENRFEIARGSIQYPVPCRNGTSNHGVRCTMTTRPEEQERDFGWAVDVDRILASITKPGKRTPKLRQELFARSYAPSGYPLLSARLIFDRGRLTARTLDRDEQGEYRVYRVRPGHGKTPVLRQAVSTQIELSLRVRGPVTFLARSLRDADTRRGEIELKKGDTDEVLVFVENQPEVACNSPDRTGPHFGLNYLLLDRPHDLIDFRGPEDESLFPVMNAQCSPPTFSFPGS